MSALAGNGSGYKYRGSFVYSVSFGGTETLESIACNEGRITVSYSAGESVSYYDQVYFRDHLGSTRMVMDITLANLAPSIAVIEKSDYTPFGTRVPITSSTTNRWRFSGKEEQTIGANDLQLLDFGARYYDPWLARWTTQDPKAGKYTSFTPYSYCAGNPVNLVDPNGDRIKIYYSENGVTKAVYYSGKVDGNVSNPFVRSVIEAYHYNKENWVRAGYSGQSPLAELVERDDITVSIKDIGSYPEEATFQLDECGNPTIYWSPIQGAKYETGVVVSPATILSHESDHAIDYLNDAREHDSRFKTPDKNYRNNEERRVILGSEQKTARANGETTKGQLTRTSYDGKTVIVSGGPTSIVIDKFESLVYETKTKNWLQW